MGGGGGMGVMRTEKGGRKREREGTRARENDSEGVGGEEERDEGGASLRGREPRGMRTMMMDDEEEECRQGPLRLNKRQAIRVEKKREPASVLAWTPRCHKKLPRSSNNSFTTEGSGSSKQKKIKSSRN